MQVWNVLHAARWNTGRDKSPWAPSYNFVGLYPSNQDTYRQSEKNSLSSNMSSTCPHNMVNFGLLAAGIGWPVWQRFCTASSSGRQPNFAALNRGRHLCSAGRPSRWTLAHILVCDIFAYFGQNVVAMATFLRPCNQKYLLWFGRPLKPYHRTKNVVNSCHTSKGMSIRRFATSLTLRE